LRDEVLSCCFLLHFLAIITLGPFPDLDSLEMLDLDPDPDSMKSDPQIW
jgi:hypothetical protein